MLLFQDNRNGLVGIVEFVALLANDAVMVSSGVTFVDPRAITNGGTFRDDNVHDGAITSGFKGFLDGLVGINQQGEIGFDLSDKRSRDTAGSHGADFLFGSSSHDFYLTFLAKGFFFFRLTITGKRSG